MNNYLNIEPVNHKGNTNTWLTPKHIIDSLGPFDLDPCAAPLPRPFDTAKKHYTEEMNGLSLNWDGFVFCNPPYGKFTKVWLEKLKNHGNGIALVFARTDTKWFQDIAVKSDLILFLKGRISFLSKEGKIKTNAGIPSVFLAFGELAAHRLKTSSLKGVYMIPILDGSSGE